MCERQKLLFMEKAPTCQLRKKIAKQDKLKDGRTIREMIWTYLWRRVMFKMLMDPMGGIVEIFRRKEFEMATYNAGRFNLINMLKMLDRIINTKEMAETQVIRLHPHLVRNCTE